jgi:hypothetical protein
MSLVGALEAGTIFTKAGVVVDDENVYVELASSETDSLAVGTYECFIRATLPVSGNVVTLVHSTATVTAGPA